MVEFLVKWLPLIGFLIGGVALIYWSGQRQRRIYAGYLADAKRINDETIAINREILEKNREAIANSHEALAELREIKQILKDQK